MPALFGKQLDALEKWNFQRFSIDDWGSQPESKISNIR